MSTYRKEKLKWAKDIQRLETLIDKLFVLAGVNETVREVVTYDTDGVMRLFGGTFLLSLHYLRNWTCCTMFYAEQKQQRAYGSKKRKELHLKKLSK